MKVVILCGGQGTRIRDVSEALPKPMIPIGGYPILWHIMRYYAHFDFKDFVLCLGYKSSSIKDFFMNYRSRISDFTIDFGRDEKIEYHASAPIDWRVTMAETGELAMTGARIRKIRNFVKNDEYFMLTYGDGLGDIDLNQLLEFHRKHGKLCTVTGVRPPGRYGELRATDFGSVTEFNEKPQTSGGRISGGFFVCSSRIFDYIDDGDDVVFEKDPMKRLVAENQLMMFEHDGFWQPMDTHREYLLLNGLFSEGKAPWVQW
jgi:glucose-1-phosphate cytidylyltransferase